MNPYNAGFPQSQAMVEEKRGYGAMTPQNVLDQMTPVLGAIAGELVSQKHHLVCHQSQLQYHDSSIQDLKLDVKNLYAQLDATIQAATSKAIATIPEVAVRVFQHLQKSQTKSHRSRSRSRRRSSSAHHRSAQNRRSSPVRRRSISPNRRSSRYSPPRPAPPRHPSPVKRGRGRPRKNPPPARHSAKRSPDRKSRSSGTKRRRSPSEGEKKATRSSSREKPQEEKKEEEVRTPIVIVKNPDPLETPAPNYVRRTRLSDAVQKFLTKIGELRATLQTAKPVPGVDLEELRKECDLLEASAREKTMADTPKLEELQAKIQALLPQAL